MYEFTYLGQDDVIAAGATDMKKAIEDVEETFRLHAAKSNILPIKTILRWGGLESEYETGRINAMPAYLGGRFDIAGIKWIASFPANPFKFNMPRASGVIILNDAHTGWPLAVMDGTLISAIRTGAVTGVAAKYLARNDSEIAGIIGTGVQARTQLMALNEILTLKEVRAFDIRMKRSKVFVNEMSERLGLNIRQVSTAREAVEGSNVFVTTTTAHEPIVRDAWVDKGSFYSHIGGYEDEFEVALQSDKIIVDDWEQVKHRGAQTLALMHERGILNDENIYAELGEIVIGEKAGRENPEERIYLCSVGMGTEDLAVASRIYNVAREKGIGERLKLWTRPAWV